LAISGAASTFTNVVDMNGGAYVDNIQIGITGDNEIDTASGNLTIDSAGGTTTIDDTLSITGDLNLTGGFNLAEYIVHDGDTNTKFGFPAADTYVITTAGTERVRVGAGGSVGIGTNDPKSRLDLLDSATTKANFRHASSNETSLYIESDDTSARIGSTYYKTGGAFKPLALLTSGTARVTITAAGNVGIASAAASTPLYVVGDTTLSGDTTFHGDSYNLVWDKSDNALEFADNAKVLIGTGGDLELYHDGSNSYIHDGGTGGLYIRAANALGFRDVANSNAVFADFTSGGSVDLYYNGSKKFETTNGGAKVTGNLETTGITTSTGGFVGALTGNVTGTATNATHVTVADNEATNENNLIPFIEDASATGNVGLESDGDFHYNPSTGTVTATLFAGSGANLTNVPMTVTETSYGGTSQISYASNTLTITANSNAYGYRTVSTSDPSSGNNGDVWYKY